MNSIIEQALGTTKYLTSFGKQRGDTTVKERTEVFLNLWNEWVNKSITFPDSIYAIRGYYPLKTGPEIEQWQYIKMFAKKHDLWEFHDYQVRGSEVRFKCEDHALLFRLQL